MKIQNLDARGILKLGQQVFLALSFLIIPHSAYAYTSTPDYQIWCFFAAILAAPAALLLTVGYLGGEQRWMRNLALLCLFATTVCVLIAWDGKIVKVITVMVAIGCVLLINWKMSRIAYRRWRYDVEDQLESDRLNRKNQ